METQCPHCSKDVVFGDEVIGTMKECPECGNLFHVKGPERVCPYCDYPLEPNRIVCLNCGYNLETKQLINTEIAGKEHLLPLWQRIFMFLIELLPGVFRPFNVILFLACALLALVVFYICVNIIACGMIMEGIAIGSLGLVIYSQGTVFLLSDTLQFINNALIEFNEKQWYAFIIMVFGPCIGVFILLIQLAKILYK